MEHHIIVAGIGPGAPEYILPAAKSAIAQAAVLAGSGRALADYASSGAKTQAITGNIEETLAFIERELKNADVTVMVSGDPGYYSLLAALNRRFARERIRVIPGISSMQFAFSRLALPWQEAKLLSFHGRLPDETELDWKEGRILGILTDSVYDSQKIAARLLAHGWPNTAAAHICARLSYPDETILRLSLAECSQSEGAGHCILIVNG